MPTICKLGLNENGSTLPLVLCLLLIISTISALLIQMSHGQIKQMTQWKLHADLEEKTETLLNQCEKHLEQGLALITHPMNCCVIETSPPQKNKTYFRVSVFGSKKDPINRDDSQAPSTFLTRLQSIWVMETSPTTSKKKNLNSLQRISWREVIDLDWEYAMSHQQRSIWEDLQACDIK
jgi:hypothetical protein